MNIIKSIAGLMLGAGLTLIPVPAVYAQYQPYLGDIMLTGFNFCPPGWAQAHGQLLPISQYDALYALYGTRYGGDGRSTFALPDLRGRVLIGTGFGSGFAAVKAGDQGGHSETTMTTAMMPPNHHSVNTSATAVEANGTSPSIIAASTGAAAYATGSPDQALAMQTVQSTGSGYPFENTAPSLVLNYCVALAGIFPSRN